MSDALPPSAWLVDKPPGLTSHDVVAAVRRRMPRRTKVGHAGTLDPFATGLLIVLGGRATRLARVLTDRPKRYEAVIAFGATSATGDPEGPITDGGPVPAEEAVRAVVGSFLGPQQQRVPAFSAVKVDGRRLYRSARAGVAVERPVRDIVVHRIDLIGWDAERGLARIDVEVSKGTYIRQLAADIGERLGCGGYCAALRRTAVGALEVADAIPPDDVSPDTSVPLAAALGHLPQLMLGDDDARAVAFGRSVPAEAPPGEVVLRQGDVVLALAVTDGHIARPTVVLADPAGTVRP